MKRSRRIVDSEVPGTGEGVLERSRAKIPASDRVTRNSKRLKEDVEPVAPPMNMLSDREFLVRMYNLQNESNGKCLWTLNSLN